MTYINYIVANQSASGWLGPDDMPTDGNEVSHHIASHILRSNSMRTIYMYIHCGKNNRCQ